MKISDSNSANHRIVALVLWSHRNSILELFLIELNSKRLLALGEQMENAVIWEQFEFTRVAEE